MSSPYIWKQKSHSHIHTTTLEPTPVSTKVYNQKYEWMNECMIGVLGHDSALVRLSGAGDNLGEWDEFCYEPCPWRHQKYDKDSIMTHINKSYIIYKLYKISPFILMWYKT